MKLVFPLTIKMMHDKSSSDAPYVAYNVEFDIASCGPTEEKARKNAREAVEILLEEAEKKGKLNELLRDAGFAKNKNEWALPRITVEPFSFSLAS